MKQVASILVLTLFISQGFSSLFPAKEWNDLRIRFDVNPFSAFYKSPRTTNDVLINNYRKVEPEADFKLPIDFYCYPDDPRACLMFDKKGNIAGVQISFVEADFSNVKPEHYNYSANTNFIKTNFWNTPAFSFRTYFTNPEKLTEEGRQNTKDTAEGLWFYLEGKLFQVPTEEPSADKFGDFYRQGCLQGMGRHFFYKVNKDASCDNLFPVFVLYEKKKLVGYGHATVGDGKKQSRNWYEHPPKPAISFIAPNRPKCMDDLQSTYGVTSMHVYFVKYPLLITCF